MCGMMFGWLAPTYPQVWVVGKLLMEHHKKRVEVRGFFQNSSFAMQTILFIQGWGKSGKIRTSGFF